jgi:hypothetical protein
VERKQVSEAVGDLSRGSPLQTVTRKIKTILQR